MFKGLLFFIKFGWKVDKRYIIYNILNQFVQAIVPLSTIAMPKYIIDEMIGQQRFSYLATYVLVLAGCNFIGGSLSKYFTMTCFTLRCKLSAQFGLFLHKNLYNADFENLEKPSFLDLKEKANKFLYGDWQGFSYVFDSALQVIGQAFIMIGITTILLTFSIWVVIVFFILLSISALIDGKAKDKGRKLSLEAVNVERRWNYFGNIFENIEFAKELRVNLLGDWFLQKESDYSKTAVDFYRKRNHFYIVSGFWESILYFVQLVIALSYLIYQVVTNKISIGDFTMYISAVVSFTTALRTVLGSFMDVKTYGVYYDAVDDYLNLPSKMHENQKRSVPSGSLTIEFKNVSFRYPGQNKNALENISLTITPGEKLSIVGENGAGKTTFVKLLCRLYDPTEGQILINNVDIREIDYSEYMGIFATVFQDYKLFSLSLLDNIVLASTSPFDDTRVMEIIKEVGLSNKVASLNKGLLSNIYKDFDANGFEPSGGEGQKIALARALYKDAPIIILDEPTAALDPRAEYDIYQNFNELVCNKTAVYISHRLSSAKFCDKIAVFQSGKIVEYGTHEELFALNGLYKELFSMQAQFYTDSSTQPHFV